MFGMNNSHFRVRSIQAGLTMIIFRFVSFIWDYFLNAFKDRPSHSVRLFTEKQFYVYGFLAFEIVSPGFSGW